MATLCCAGAAVAAGLSRAQYTGTTSERTVVRLRLSSDGHRIAKLRIYYMISCDSGETHKTRTDIFGLRIAKDGSFSGRGTYTGAQDSSTNHFKISGVVSSSRAKGKFSLTAVDQTRTVHCRTGTVTWTAKRVT